MKSIPKGGPGPPARLFHYTNDAGLLGILGSQTMWATDFRFLNDTMEVTYARDLLAKAVARRIQLSHSARVRDGLMRLERNLAMIADPGLYVTCFCADGDLLSQWRGYAPSRGYSMGFSTAEWTAQDDGPAAFPTRLAQVIYDQNQQSREINVVLRRVIRAVRRVPAGGGAAADVAIGHAILDRIVDIAGLLIRLKHPKFAEEREWRVIALAGHAAPQDISYRPSPVGLIPYVVLALKDQIGPLAGRLPVAEVVHGPSAHPSTTLRGLRGILDKFGYDPDNARPSEIPYRGAQ